MADESNDAGPDVTETSKDVAENKSDKPNEAMNITIDVNEKKSDTLNAGKDIGSSPSPKDAKKTKEKPEDANASAANLEPKSQDNSKAHSNDETQAQDSASNTGNNLPFIRMDSLNSEDSNMSVSSTTMTSSTTSSSKGTEKAEQNGGDSVNTTGTKKKKRRRGSAWSDDETEFLMEIWARQAEIARQKMKKDTGKGDLENVTCIATYRLISQEMAKKNFFKSVEQCKTRIHTLKRAYKITSDEINSGAKTITYCRHYDKLRIIHNDHPEIIPAILAATLEEKRLKSELENKPKIRVPVKRKLIVGEPPADAVKAPEVQTTPLPSFSTFAQPSNSNTSSWYPAQSTPSSTPNAEAGQRPTSILQMSLSTPLKGVHQYNQNGSQQPNTHPYNSQGLSSSNMHQEINNNQLSIKTEKPDPAFQGQNGTAQWNNTLTPVNNAQNIPQGQGQSMDDLERMRLDLEMKRLDVERNKIEMEERQRREDRDHQFRMMQLLMFGLGQSGVSAHGMDVTHAHNPDLSRALEIGLVPGGQQMVNEKGLSFSEI